jgi:hypothetical protein
MIRLLMLDYIAICKTQYNSNVVFLFVLALHVCGRDRSLCNDQMFKCKVENSRHSLLNCRVHITQQVNTYKKTFLETRWRTVGTEAKCDTIRLHRKLQVFLYYHLEPVHNSILHQFFLYDTVLLLTFCIHNETKIRNVFIRSEAGIVGSNPTQGMDVWCEFVFCV